MNTSSLSFTLGVLVGAMALAGGFILGGANQNTATIPPATSPATPAANQPLTSPTTSLTISPAPSPHTSPPQQPPAQNVLQATQLQIVDELGTVVMVLGSNKDGGTISLRDRFGKALVLIGAAEHGGALIIRNANAQQPAFIAQADAAGGAMRLFTRDGQLAAETAVKPSGAQLQLHDKTSRRMISLAADAEEGGVITTHCGAGEIAARLFSNIQGEGVFETYRPNGSPLVSLSSTEGGHGQVTTFAGLNKPLVMLTATANHEGQMYTLDAEGRTMLALATSPTGPTLRLFNRFGEPIITLDSTEQGEAALGLWKRDGAGRTLGP